MNNSKSKLREEETKNHHQKHEEKIQKWRKNERKTPKTKKIITFSSHEKIEFQLQQHPNQQ
jgi:hypothetical protein